MSVRGLPKPEFPEQWRQLWKSYWTIEEKEEIVRVISAVPILTPEQAESLAEAKELFAQDQKNYLDVIESLCPIGWFKPSYDQAQVLNAWSPQYEPDLAPFGYQTILDFRGNRCGKTSSHIADTLLWMIPNDPDWLMWEEYEDDFGRGKYQVLPRPDWKHWRKTGRMVYPWLNAPPRDGRNYEVWHGVSDRSSWDQTVGKEYRKWMPSYEFGRRGIKNEEDWNKTEMSFRTRHGHTVYGKLYGSDSQAWAGKACDRLNFDEGMDEVTLNEAMARLKTGATVYWAYTPAEAKNLGNRTALAHRAYKGDYKMQGKVKALIGQGADTTPNYIMPDDQKRENITRWDSMGAEGRARRQGGFFDSSPVVFNHFQRDFHVLEMDDKEFLEKHGQRCNLFRGIDEGIAHPGTCIWAALLPSGEHVIYRDYSKVGASISDRVKDIIELSGNEIVVTKTSGKGDSESEYRREKFVRERFRGTNADWHLWARKNENLSQTRADDYRRAGIIIRKGTALGPEARCDNVNDMFRKDHTRLHLTKGSAPGTRLYVTRNCTGIIERLENYLHDQYKSGPNKGAFKGTPEALGDDLIDAMCLDGSTMAQTNKGEIPIKEIVPGDLVLTRNGYRKVINGGMTGQNTTVLEVILSNGRSLVATPNHKVFLPESGWTRVDALSYGDIMCPCPTQNVLYSTGSSSEDIRIQNISAIKAIIAQRRITPGEESGFSTSKFGRLITDLFLRGIKFTIGTVIRLTTRSEILSALLLKSTGNTIQSRIRKSSCSTWRKLGHWLQNGTQVNRDWSGIGSMGNWLRQQLGPKIENGPIIASNAERSTGIFQTGLDTAEVSVSKEQEEGRGYMYASRHARIAEGLAKEENTANPVYVVAVQPKGVGDVYNLSVEKDPEFFANGVLVHNCYSLLHKLHWSFQFDPESTTDLPLSNEAPIPYNPVTGYAPISR